MNLRLTTILALTLLVTGCTPALLKPKPMPPLKRYTMTTTETVEAQPQRITPDSLLPALSIYPLESLDWLRESRMYYQKTELSGAKRMEAYGFSEWATPPVYMVEQALRARLIGSGAFQAVTSPVDIAGENLVLKIRLRDFSQHFIEENTSVGRVAILATLIEVKENTLVAQRLFTTEIPAANADAEGGVTALSTATQQCLQEMEDWLIASARGNKP